MRIAPVEPGELHELVELLVAYCEFYDVRPGAGPLAELARVLLRDPAQGVQLLARGSDGSALGFATVFWTWSTTRAVRIGVMNDLFVVAAHRGGGIGAALIEACAERCRASGVPYLEWRTAPGNETAQRLYDRVAPGPRDWRHYRLETGA